MSIVVDIIVKSIDNFVAKDFNHREPDSLMISQHLYYNIRRSIDFLNENPTRSDNYTIFGMQIIVVSNKDNLLKVFIMDDL